MATIAAEMEARHHGATFGQDPFVFFIHVGRKRGTDRVRHQERSFRLESEALETLRPSSGVGGKNEAVRVKYKKPKRWSSMVSPTAVSSTEFAGGHNYIKRWRLPSPPEMETDKAKESVNTIPPLVHEDEEGGNEEEEMDDLKFFREALRVPNRQE